MTPDEMLDVIEVLDAIDLGDYALFKRRQALVADLGLDERDIVARCKFLQVMRLTFHGQRFDVDIQGVEPVPAVVLGALDAYEKWLDMVAWPIGDPRRYTALSSPPGVSRRTGPSRLASRSRMRRTANAA